MELIEVIKNVFAIGALACVSYLSVTASIAVRTLEKHTSATIMNVNQSVVELNKTLNTVNSKGGTLQQVDESVVRVKDLITLTQATLYKQQKSIDSFDVEIHQSLENLNYVLHTTDDTEKALGAQAVNTLQTTNSVLLNVNNELPTVDAELQTMLKASAQINDMLPTVQQTLINTRDTTANVDAATADVKNFIHKETTPKKLTFWGGMEAGAVWAHKILMPSIF